MMPDHAESRVGTVGGEPVEARSYAKAILNILEDSAADAIHLEATQKAILNVLEDAAGEASRLEATQRAILNILDDAAEEKARLAETQHATLNILDDFDAEKRKVEQVNDDLRAEIAERIRLEAALRHAKTTAESASRELESFSYSVAHDLRAPLRSIDGFGLAILEDFGDRLDVDGKRYLKHVRDATRQMGELIDALLDLSRVTRTEIRRERVDVSALAHEVLAKLREADPDRQVEIVVEAGLEAQVDRRLLEVVLVNLLGNAWKFTGKTASARIEVASRRADKPVVFLVRDNGAGFNAAHAGKLFGAFQRLHRAQDFEGTGIGLATVQRIVHRHGGRIWAEGELGRGATFFFTLDEKGQT